jgi:hypothetical protein
MQTPQAPTQVPAPAPVVVGVPEAPAAPITAGPTTIRELDAIKSRRSELSNQLISSAGRRDRLMRELNQAPAGPARAGLEQRIAVLDKRILQLETDIAETGRQLTTSQAGLLTATSPQRSFGDMWARSGGTISNVFIVFVLAPLAIAAARNMWRKGNRPPAAPRDAENARRLDQLQQSIDTIAIEVERVSEGQRFVTRLLSEQQKMQPLAAPHEQRDTSLVAREGANAT